MEAGREVETGGGGRRERSREITEVTGVRTLKSSSVEAAPPPPPPAHRRHRTARRQRQEKNRAEARSIAPRATGARRRGGRVRSRRGDVRAGSGWGGGGGRGRGAARTIRRRSGAGGVAALGGEGHPCRACSCRREGQGRSQRRGQRRGKRRRSAEVTGGRGRSAERSREITGRSWGDHESTGPPPSPSVSLPPLPGRNLIPARMVCCLAREIGGGVGGRDWWEVCGGFAGSVWR